MGGGVNGGCNDAHLFQPGKRIYIHLSEEEWEMKKRGGD